MFSSQKLISPIFSQIRHFSSPRSPIFLTLGNKRDQLRRKPNLPYLAGIGSEKEIQDLLDPLTSDERATKLSTTVEGKLPLHSAAQYVQPNKLEILLQYGADPQQRDSYDRTAIECALDHHNHYQLSEGGGTPSSIIHTLLKASHNIGYRTKDKYGERLLVWATSFHIRIELPLVQQILKGYRAAFIEAQFPSMAKFDPKS